MDWQYHEEISAASWQHCALKGTVCMQYHGVGFVPCTIVYYHTCKCHVNCSKACYIENAVLFLLLYLFIIAS
jgi:hypothetical protein